VVLGEFGRAHSLKGEVRLKSSTADPLAIVSYSPLRTDDGRKVTLTRVRPAPGAAPDILIAVVEGVTTREAAEALNRTRLLLERDRLPPAEDEDEFLLADLVGLSVETPDGKPLGRVVGVPNYGGGDLLEIAPVKRGPTGLLPFTRPSCPWSDIRRPHRRRRAGRSLTPAKPQPDIRTRRRRSAPAPQAKPETPR
jgi:16S rRNA processing protein RimM